MSAQVPPLLSRIGIVGYGEVGRILAEDLRARGVARIRAYDVKLGTAAESPLREHASRSGVELATSHADLASNVDLVLSAVTARETVAVAEAVAPAIAKVGTVTVPLQIAAPRH